MQTEQPLVSILMTAYNREDYITESIESVLANSYTNWELIIVDDQSKDKTLYIAKSYESLDSRIKVYINETNLGDYPNRNKAASLAKGKYIKYLDSDDILYSHGLEIMVGIMETFPQAGIGFANYWNTYKCRLPKLLNPQESYYNHYFKGGLLFVGPTGSIYNRDFFNNIGKFNPIYGVATDVEFNLKAAQKSPVVCFQNDLIWWRQHENQEFIKRKYEYEKLYEKINTLFLNHQDCPLTQTDIFITKNNLKNLQARKIINLYTKFQILEAYRNFKELNIKVSQILLCVLPSKWRRYFQMLIKSK